MFWTMESLTLVIYRWWIDWIKWNLMPNRSLITVNSTKASLALVPLSHPLFSSTKPPFHLFHRTTLRFVSDSTLSSALQSRSSVCSTYHPIRLFHKATLFFVDWVTPFFTKRIFCLSHSHLCVCLFLSQTYLFVCCTDLFRCCTDQRFCLHLRETFHFQKASHAFIAIAKPVKLSLLSAFHDEDDLSHIFIIFDLIFWIETCIHERKLDRNLRPEFPAKIGGESNALGVTSLECTALYS